MKTIFFFFTLMLLNSATIAQKTNENRLTQTIDSLQNIIDENNRKINALITSNLEIENELNKYNSQLNDALYENQIDNVFICTMGTFLYAEPGCYNSLSRLNRGDSVSVVEILSEIYKVYFNGIYGYVLKSGFGKESEVQDEFEREKQQKLAEEKRKIQQKLAEEKRKLEIIRKYGKEIAEKLFNGHYWLGMTDEMARASLGYPDDINRTVGSWGVHEQWIYDRYKVYLYFENGKLTSYQDKK